MSLFEHYNFPGVPAWMIYSSDKELKSDGKYDSGFIVGYPNDPEGMAIYLDAIRSSSRHIGKKKLRLLAEKLEFFDKH